MRMVSFFNKGTGLFNGSHMICSDDAAVALNTPPDHIAIDGHHDHLSKCVDVFCGAPEIVDAVNQYGIPTGGKLTLHKVIEYQPPAPSADHEWNAETKRWQLSAAVMARQQGRTDALAAIAVLEAQCIRPMRELALGFPGAQERVAAIDSQIAELRKCISEVTSNV
jgi:hypothetical protein